MSEGKLQAINQLISDTNHLQQWNFHAQNTYVGQGDPGFPAKYSGPNSLNSKGEVQETATLDFFASLRLWRGAELHMDFLAWQGFGLSQTFGIEAFPNGDAYKAGTAIPDFTFANLFIRQTIGLGGEQEEIPEDPNTLKSKQDISRLTFTVGRLSPLEICDGNTYAHDPHTQFLNWGMMGNLAWDYGQDQVGYTTGLAVELHQRNWSLNYGFFQMPGVKNGFTEDDQVLMWPFRGTDGPLFKSWATMLEFERRYRFGIHPGAIRLLSWIDEADFANYNVATALLFANPPDLSTVGQGSGVTIPQAARAYRYKYGFGLNWEQKIAQNLGVFSRIGWNNGQEESWTFTDVNWTFSLGLSIKGDIWNRKDDNIGIAGIVCGASVANQKFLEAGGTDMLSGDGTLNYNPEKVLEIYYDLKIWKAIHTTLDYQFVANPAFNADRGPVSVFGGRVNWQF